MGGYHTVVVGTDGSDSSLRAVERAAYLASGPDSQLVIATAYLPADEDARAADLLKDEGYKVTGNGPIYELLRDAKDRAKSAGATNIEERAVVGAPVDVLVDVAVEVGADLLVVGNVGMNTIAGRLLGSVPANVARRSKTDVLIVHTADWAIGGAPPPTPVRTRLWVDGTLKSENFPLSEVSEHIREHGSLVWVDLCNPTAEVLDRLAGEVGLSTRAVADVLGHTERTRATRYADHTFLTVYATALGPQIPGSIESRLHSSRVSVFVLPSALVTVRRETDAAQPVLDIDAVVGHWVDNADLLRMGSRALMLGLLDIVVEGQFDTIQQLDDAIESLEDGLFDDRTQTRQLQRDTYRLRKELVELRRIVLPMREVVNTVMRRSADANDSAELTSWYQDLYDNVIRAAEWTESLRDMITTVFETNLSLQDARLNTIMKKLTGWAAIIAVPTLVTGWYGQNVPYPGYGAVAGVVASGLLTVFTALLLFVAFKRRNWI